MKKHKEMADFQKAIAFVLKNEGVYSDDSEDSGGETKYGISQQSYPHLDIKNLTQEEALEIYRKDFWQPYQDLPEKVAIKVFDYAVNMGHQQAVKILQKALRCCGASQIQDDGILGPLTKQALRIINPDWLIIALRSEAAGFYRLLVAKNSKNQKFLNGWLNRSYL